DRGGGGGAGGGGRGGGRRRRRGPRRRRYPRNRGDSCSSCSAACAVFRKRIPCTMYWSPETTVKTAATHTMGLGESGSWNHRAPRPARTVRIWKKVAALPTHVGRG